MKLRSRVISMLLAFCMLLSMLPPQPITAVEMCGAQKARCGWVPGCIGRSSTAAIR